MRSRINVRSVVFVVLGLGLFSAIVFAQYQNGPANNSQETGTVMSVEVRNGQQKFVPNGRPWKLMACHGALGTGPGQNLQVYFRIGDQLFGVLADHSANTNSTNEINAAIGIAPRVTNISGSFFYEHPLPNVSIPPGSFFAFVVLVDGDHFPDGGVTFRCLIEED